MSSEEPQRHGSILNVLSLALHLQNEALCLFTRENLARDSSFLIVVVIIYANVDHILLDTILLDI